MKRGKLHIIATPIGNLGDITFRAIQTLKSVDFIAAEDTRRSARLLKHYEIPTAMTSYHDFTRGEKRKRIIGRILNGEDAALISDAGTPGISDPGYRLIGDALAEGIEVIAVPGPSVLIAALSVSGLPTDSFYFRGYLPSRPKARRVELEKLRARKESLAFYEAPHRLLVTLEDMEDILGDRRIAVIRELTKLHEEVFRGQIQEARAHFQEKKIQGEITLIVQGAPEEKVLETELDLRTEVERVIREQDVTRKQAVRIVAEAYGIPRNRVYKESLGKPGE